jgi:hypothetical protein
METTRFTSEVRTLHATLAPQLPIGNFVKTLKPKDFGYPDARHFYENVNFSVKIFGGINAPNGIMRLSVPVHANENWLRDMKARFLKVAANQVPSGTLPEHVDFRTMDGRSVSTFDPSRLHTTGKLHLYVNDRKVILDEMPRVPLEYSTQKVASIGKWMDATVNDRLPTKVATLLANKTAHEIDEAVEAGGLVERTIMDHLKSSVPDWKEFVRTHHKNSPVSMTDAEADKALRKIARKTILTRIRTMIGAAAPMIKEHVTALELERKQKAGKNTALHAPILGSLSAAGAAPIRQNGQELFQRIMRDAFDHPDLQNRIRNLLYNRPLGAGCRWDESEDPRRGVYYVRPAPPAAGGGGVVPQNNNQGGGSGGGGGGGGSGGSGGGGGGGGGGGSGWGWFGFGGGGGSGGGARDPITQWASTFNPSYYGGADAAITSLGLKQREAVAKTIGVLASRLEDIDKGQSLDQLTSDIARLIAGSLADNVPQGTFARIRGGGIDWNDLDDGTINALGLMYGLYLENSGMDKVNKIKVIATVIATKKRSAQLADGLAIFNFTNPESLLPETLKDDAVRTAFNNGKGNVIAPKPSETKEAAKQDFTFRRNDLEVDMVAAIAYFESNKDRIINEAKRSAETTLGALAKKAKGLFGGETKNKTFLDLYSNLKAQIDESFKQQDVNIADALRKVAMDGFLKETAGTIFGTYAKPFLTWYGFEWLLELSKLSDAQEMGRILLTRFHQFQEDNSIIPAAFIKYVEKQKDMFAAEAKQNAAAAAQHASAAKDHAEKAAKATSSSEAAAQSSKSAKHAQQAEEASAAAKAATTVAPVPPPADTSALPPPAAPLPSTPDLSASNVPATSPPPPPPAQPKPDAPKQTAFNPSALPSDLKEPKYTRKRITKADKQNAIDFLAAARSNQVLTTFIDTTRKMLANKSWELAREYIKDSILNMDDIDAKARVSLLDWLSTEYGLDWSQPEYGEGVDDVIELIEDKDSDVIELIIDHAIFFAAKKGPIVAIDVPNNEPESAQTKPSTSRPSLGLTEAVKKELLEKIRDAFSPFQRGLSVAAFKNIEEGRSPQSMLDVKDMSKDRHHTKAWLRYILGSYDIFISEEDFDKMLKKELWQMVIDLPKNPNRSFIKIDSPLQNLNPWNALIHHTIAPIGGAYPTYYNVLHTKQDMSASAPYKGDAEATYDAYHLYAGMGAAALRGKVINSPKAAAPLERELPKALSIAASFREEELELPKTIPYNEALAIAASFREEEFELPKTIPYNEALAIAARYQEPEEVRRPPTKLINQVLIEKMASRMVPIEQEDRYEAIDSPADEEEEDGDFGFPPVRGAFQ